MTSKWREFWIDTLFDHVFPSKEVADNIPHRIGKYEPVHVIEKAALDEALELIGELEHRIMALLTCATSQDPIYTQEVYMREVGYAEQALKKIKAFRDRGAMPASEIYNKAEAARGLSIIVDSTIVKLQDLHSRLSLNPDEHIELGDVIVDLYDYNNGFKNHALAALKEKK